MRQNNFLTIASKVSLGVNNSNCLLKREARTTETPGPIKLFVRYLRICLVATHTKKTICYFGYTTLLTTASACVCDYELRGTRTRKRLSLLRAPFGFREYLFWLN